MKDVDHLIDSEKPSECHMTMEVMLPLEVHL